MTNEETESVVLKTVMKFHHRLFDDVNCNTKALTCVLALLLLFDRITNNNALR